MPTHIEMRDALIALFPEGGWGLIGTELVMPDDQMPSDDEINAEITRQKSAPTIQLLAARKRIEIDSSAAKSVAGIRSLYPDFERETWGDQEDEARAWTADNTAPTPTLTGIAEARGVTVEYLAPKVIEKANQYRALATSVAGKRQRLEDDIAAALETEDRESLETIEWSNAE